MGISYHCSYCKKHPWKRSNFKPTKKSVFARVDQSSEEDAESGFQDSRSETPRERSNLGDKPKGYVIANQMTSSDGTAQTIDVSMKPILGSADAHVDGVGAVLRSEPTQIITDELDDKSWRGGNGHLTFPSLSEKVAAPCLSTIKKSQGAKIAGDELDETEHGSKDEGEEGGGVLQEGNHQKMLADLEIGKVNQVLETVKCSQAFSADVVEQVEDHLVSVQAASTSKSNGRFASLTNDEGGEGKVVFDPMLWVTKKETWSTPASQMAEELDSTSDSKFQQTGDGGEEDEEKFESRGSILDDGLAIYDLESVGLSHHLYEGSPKQRFVANQTGGLHGEMKDDDLQESDVKPCIHPVEIQGGQMLRCESLEVSDVEDVTSLDDEEEAIVEFDDISEVAKGGGIRSDQSPSESLPMSSLLQLDASNLFEVPKETELTDQSDLTGSENPERVEPMDSDDAKASPSKSSSGGSLTNQQLATGSHGASSSNGNMKSNMKGKDDSGEQNGRKKPNTDERKSVFKVDNAPLFYVGGRNGVSL